MLAQDFGHRRDFRAQGTLVPQRNDLSAKTIATRQHRRVSRRGGDVGAEGVFEEHARLRKTVDMWCGQPMVAEAAHVVRAYGVNGD